MVYKRFSVLVFIRITLMLVVMSIIANIILNPNKIFTTLVLIIVLILQIAELIYYVNKTNRTLSYFLSSLKDKDFTSSSNIEIVDKSFQSLNQSFKDITQTIFDSKIEKEAQYHLLNLIVSKVETGILLLDKEQQITLINDTAKNYLHLTKFHSLNDIKNQNQMFYDLIKENKLPNKKVIETIVNHEKKQFLVFINPVLLINKNYTLITFNDIKEEMEIKEVQSWQKLLRTLSHEIMNSVTPISSLSETGLLQIQNERGNLRDISEIDIKSLEKIQKALNTIGKRSTNLYHFVDDFRKLAKLPIPVKKNFKIKELVESVVQLLSPELSKSNIDLETSFSSEDIEISADFSQIEQVLINLILNAKDALQTFKNPIIKIFCRNIDKRIQLMVIDNGIGITDEQIDKIFIPFYTTKEKGSGIGLSLSRQIMHLHGGNISVKSDPNIETTFILQF